MDIRDVLASKTDVARPRGELPLVQDSSTLLSLHSVLVHDVSTESEQHVVLPGSGNAMCNICCVEMGEKDLLYDITSGGTFCRTRYELHTVLRSLLARATFSYARPKHFVLCVQTVVCTWYILVHTRCVTLS